MSIGSRKCWIRKIKWFGSVQKKILRQSCWKMSWMQKTWVKEIVKILRGADPKFQLQINSDPRQKGVRIHTRRAGYRYLSTHLNLSSGTVFSIHICQPFRYIYVRYLMVCESCRYVRYLMVCESCRYTIHIFVCFFIKFVSKCTVPWSHSIFLFSVFVGRYVCT